ncbi:hypothetical protein HDF26_003089 [Pedobacter cryoconitis]|uniref:ACT domain-containing protein n=1 Tax=Pedobacter cryoconitis TaxID=188932 RepID=UPI00162100DE|nr:ACT domain-containing protein [Pedobacter cryoconitis]MBB6272632.1 hypothetical protein [Pedobacter cryoconitis]
MKGETDLSRLLKTMKPAHNAGDYVFCIVSDLNNIPIAETTMLFKEQEGFTLILTQSKADEFGLDYTAVFSWITLTVHSSLEAVGLTAAFFTALSAAGISCNVIAAYYHDHIFIGKNDTEKAMDVLNSFSV